MLRPPRKFIGYDLPTSIIKAAPDYSSVYVISKGKIVSARSALRPVAVPNSVAPPKQSHPLPRADKESGSIRCQGTTYTY